MTDSIEKYSTDNATADDEHNENGHIHCRTSFELGFHMGELSAKLGYMLEHGGQRLEKSMEANRRLR